MRSHLEPVRKDVDTEFELTLKKLYSRVDFQEMCCIPETILRLNTCRLFDMERADNTFVWGEQSVLRTRCMVNIGRSVCW